MPDTTPRATPNAAARLAKETFRGMPRPGSAVSGNPASGTSVVSGPRDPPTKWIVERS